MAEHWVTPFTFTGRWWGPERWPASHRPRTARAHFREAVRGRRWCSGLRYGPRNWKERCIAHPTDIGSFPIPTLEGTHRCPSHP